MGSTEEECGVTGGLCGNRVVASAMDRVLGLVLGTELMFAADWLPGRLFGGLQSWTVGWGVFQLVINLACEASVDNVQLVVGGAIECTAEAHSWFRVRVVACFVQIMVMEIDEIDEVKGDEQKDNSCERIQGSRLGQLWVVSSFALSSEGRVGVVQEGGELQHMVAND